MIWPQMRTEARSDVHSQFLGWNYEDDGKKDPCAGLSLSGGWGWARGGGQEWHFLHQGNELLVHQRVGVGEHELRTQHRFPARDFVRPPNGFPSGPRGGWHFFGWAQHGPGSPRLYVTFLKDLKGFVKNRYSRQDTEYLDFTAGFGQWTKPLLKPDTRALKWFSSSHQRK